MNLEEISKKYQAELLTSNNPIKTTSKYIQLLINNNYEYETIQTFMDYHRIMRTDRLKFGLRDSDYDNRTP